MILNNQNSYAYFNIMTDYCSKSNTPHMPGIRYDSLPYEMSYIELNELIQYRTLKLDSISRGEFRDWHRNVYILSEKNTPPNKDGKPLQIQVVQNTRCMIIRNIDMHPTEAERIVFLPLCHIQAFYRGHLVRKKIKKWREKQYRRRLSAMIDVSTAIKAQCKGNFNSYVNKSFPGISHIYGVFWNERKMRLDRKIVEIKILHTTCLRGHVFNIYLTITEIDGEWKLDHIGFA